ncbi:CPBP family intramembrane glutamic endopeptidase [Staphylococcus aureus]|uniref:CPBP family intramembrane glutamic endopeptidase n=1 Tax=Staphylococcus aureus TaxID=1280 RepID=UPI0033651B90
MLIIRKHLLSILNIIAIVILGVLYFELCIHLKFLGDGSKNIYAYLITIGTSIVIYLSFKNDVKKRGIIQTKYLMPKKMSWQTKIGVITLALITASSLSALFPTNSENQKLVEANEKGMNLTTILISDAINPGVIEEICFRGILFIIILGSSSYLVKYLKIKKDWIGLIAFFTFSSVFFGFAHVAKSYDIQNIGGYLVYGIVFSFIYILTRDLKIPIAVHFLTNAMSILNRHEMGYVSLIILYVLLFLNIYVIYIKRHEIYGYMNYLVLLQS